jgi:hypothetical protein
MVSRDYGDLGPLPGTDRNDELERESLAELDRFLPKDLFRLRSEPGRDQGVDRYIEVLVDGNDTNFRAELQAKGTEIAGENQDGSISHSIDTSNFNYLLNGTCPIYVLWISNRRELRFVWARDEQRRIEAAGTDWRSQGTVTLRFAQRVSESFGEIRDRIYTAGRFHRLIHEALLLHTLAEPLALQLDPATLEVTDAATAFDRLTKAGLSFVAAGHAQIVLTQMNVLVTEQRSSPRIHLIAGYAHFVRGRVHLSRGELAEAALREEELDADDRLFLQRLLNACDVQLGHIDQPTYDAREAALTQRAGPLLQALHRLDELRYAHLRERGRHESQTLLEEMRRLAASIIDDPHSPHAAKLNARAVILYAEGHQLTSAYLAELLRVSTPSPQGETTAQGPVSVFNTRMRQWQQDVFDLVHKSQRSHHPLAVGDAYYAMASGCAALLAMAQAGEHEHGRQHPDGTELANMALGALREASAAYASIQSLQSRLRCDLVWADVAEIQGDADRSRVLATDVARQSQVMLYRDLEDRANDLLEGHSPYQFLQQQLDQARGTPEDVLHAQTDDHTLHHMAVDLADRYGIPPERAANIELHLRALRAMNQQRIDWCRRIQLLSTETDAHPDMYRESPRCAWQCLLSADRMVPGENNWQQTLDQFRALHCARCMQREPLPTG